jgi:PleD family two-component response regulator
MNAQALATRMAVLARALPPRILVVDDDQIEREAMTLRLTGAGFEVQVANNGEAALELLDRQWFPVVITDWQMPVMDGIEFTEKLRGRGVDDTYVIMLTMREASPDYERGYLSGVDDYLTKALPDSELLARIHVAFNTLSLRRTLKETRAALEAATPVDAQSGAFTLAESMAKLNSELRRAQRYGRMLAVMTVSVQSVGKEAGLPKAEALQAVIAALRQVVRTHVDWIGRMEAEHGGASFVVVLPEAGPSDGPGIKARMSRALAAFGAEAAPGRRLRIDFGYAALDRSSGDGKVIEVAEFVGVAEQCRRCPGHTGTEQLSTIQRSVAAHAAIACRHGYAVDSNCTFKAETLLAGESKSLA